ncbi:hypothetical protein RRG08_005604 [Elysia crispata]|uniref:Uncharacterized protein n=1 Tax=Elysia crispata TaxID=231223 RepID=A0AAE0YXB2_9GAST|nr:hypothetical protein RRG08_005604 [Elysia crispata]
MASNSKRVINFSSEEKELHIALVSEHKAIESTFHINSTYLFFKKKKEKCFNADTPARCVQKQPINGESIGTHSEDELPLARLKKSKAIDNAKSSGFIDPDSDYDVYLQDSDSDPEFNPGICEVRHCKDPVLSACEECDILVCYDHFMEEVNTCGQHGKKNKNDKKKD